MSRAFSAVVLLVALAHWVPLALVPVSFWVVPLECVLGVLALVLLAVTTPHPELVRPPTIRACGVRSIAGAALLGGGTVIALALSGGDTARSVVLAAVLLGLALGPLGVFEHGPVTSRRGALLAGVLAGWGGLVALAAATLEVDYLDQILAGRGAQAALAALEKSGSRLVADPPHTLRFFAWSAVPVAAAVWARLRGWPLARQEALVIALSGASWDAFTRAGEVDFARFAVLPLVLPIAFRAADLLAPRRDEEEEPASTRAFWIATLLAFLVALVPAGREGHRWNRRRELARLVAERLPAAHAELRRAELSGTRAMVARLREAAPPTTSSPPVTTPELEALAAEIEARRDEISSGIPRLTALVVDLNRLLSQSWENGGGPSEDDRRELLTARDHLRSVLDDLRILDEFLRGR